MTRIIYDIRVYSRLAVCFAGIPLGFVRFQGNQTLQGSSPQGNWVIPLCHPNPQLTAPFILPIFTVFG
jgi:hypothetical protein